MTVSYITYTYLVFQIIEIIIYKIFFICEFQYQHSHTVYLDVLISYSRWSYTIWLPNCFNRHSSKFSLINFF